MLPFRDSRFAKYGLILFFLLLALYAYFESQAMLFGPQITIPADTVTVHESFIMIRGKADNISQLHMNGTVISVTEDGFFEEPHILASGENRVILEASDKYGRSQEKVIRIIYIPEKGAATSTSPRKATP